MDLPDSDVNPETGASNGAAPVAAPILTDPWASDHGALGLVVPVLAVAAVARRLGVAPATLRTWDRRYGLGPSTRTTGSHRRYGVEDVARLDLMRRLVNSGVAPGDAARAALACDLGALPAATFALAPHPAPPSGTDAPISGYAPTTGTRSGAGVPTARAHDAGSGGQPRGVVVPELPALPGLAPAARGLGRAALALDGPACTDVILDSVGRHGVVWTWDRLLVPVLAAIGSRWEHTGEGVEVEHLASESIIAAMSGVTLRLRAPANVRPVLLACTDEETHSLPLFVVAAALSERHVAARVLGARVPHEALVAAIRRAGPAAVLVWSRVVVAELAGLAELCAVRPTPLVLAAGPGWFGPPPPGVEQVHDLIDAVRRIGSTVH
ncbi:MAG: MerR family transcriptional regulator [Candidatus Nanopelagicales bacterium]